MARGGRSAGRWPEGKRFAFTIFDDTDHTTVETGKPVYDFLTELGVTITKSVWTLEPERTPAVGGASCEDPAYLAWVRSLRDAGHEIALHNVASASSERERTQRGFDRFRELFGEDPRSLVNHFENREAIYWGEARVSGLPRAIYNVLTRRRNRFEGHLPASPFFWGDVCRERVTYVRNFVYRDADTLGACPYLPYHDPARPYVQQWFAGSEGGVPESFVETLGERNQERLERQGGLCIMYAHLGAGFSRSGRLHSGFERVMRSLAARDGWFAPVSTILDHVRATQGEWQLSDAERKSLEWRWLRDKVRSRKSTS